MLVEGGIKASLIVKLVTYRDPQQNLNHWLCPNVKPCHKVNHRRNIQREYSRQRHEPGTACHPNRHRDKEECDVPTLLDCISKSDDRQCTNQAESSRDIRANDQHDQSHYHRHDYHRVHGALGVGRSSVSYPVDEACDEGKRECESRRPEHPSYGYNIHGRTGFEKITKKVQEFSPRMDTKGLAKPEHFAKTK